MGRKGEPSKASILEMKEQLAKRILKRVRSEGHPYVELLKQGNKHIYFCILCHKPCYSDDALYQHLAGKFHTVRLATAKLTLLKPNPWPFNDSLVFFHNSSDADEDDLESRDANRERLLKLIDSDSDKDLSLVKVDEPIQADVQSSSAEADDAFVIRNLLNGEGRIDIKLKHVGWGKIAARFIENEHNRVTGVRRIWCEWLGQEKNNLEQDNLKADFALVIFPYDSVLGRAIEVDKPSLPPYASMSDSEVEGSGSRKRKKKSEMSSASLSDSEIEGSGGRKRKKRSHDSSTETSKDSTQRFSVHQNENLLLTQKILRKAARKRLRRRKMRAAAKLCNVCYQKMLPGKDVATLLNLETGKLACSTRNTIEGLFHVFHTSCLIFWVLMNETTIIKNRLVPPTRQVLKKKKKGVARDNRTMEQEEVEQLIKAAFCPECQATGGVTTELDKNGTEPAPFTLEQKFNYQMKSVFGRVGWVLSPEVVENCSVGLHFRTSELIIQEKLEAIKLLRFYRAEIESGGNAEGQGGA
ncbi:hypothetical protein PIB30_053935 [Stylosanthes scabra]|uniref:C2H2-type domain-containing protein n=1 Tax=Stylosanthes scabra TaxID=79078 RepID=A0ABU6SIX0_9FABA|nr:hypothetical protein [Stylosanthes scabra]